MKKIKWLRKLPVLVLALILALSPLLLAAPAHASSLLYGGEEGYFVSYSDADETVVFNLPDGFRSSDCSRYCFLELADGRFALVTRKFTNGRLSVFADLDNFYIRANLGLADVLVYVADLISVDGSVYTLAYTGSYEADYFRINTGDSFALAGSDVVVPDSLDPEVVDAFYSSGLGLFSVFSGVGAWLSGAVQSASSMFWTAESGLSVLGYLAVASLALAVILLLLYLIAGWLKFR